LRRRLAPASRCRRCALDVQQVAIARLRQGLRWWVRLSATFYTRVPDTIRLLRRCCETSSDRPRGMGATSRFCLPSLRSAWCRYARARIATLRVAVLTDRNVVHGRERRRCPASGSAATGPSTETAPATTSSRAHGSTAVAQPAYPGPLALYQRNPYVLKLSGINPDLTTDVSLIPPRKRSVLLPSAERRFGRTGLRHKLTIASVIQDARAIATFLRATCFARVDTLL
jgi:hypothetical protein